MGRRTHNEQDMHEGRDPTPAIQSQAAGRQTAQEIPSSPGRPPWTEGEIPMEPIRREFTMELKRASPMQPRQRLRSCKYSSTSPYKMDRTAGIKATSNIATQNDSFQDHSEAEPSKSVHIDSFQDPLHTQQQLTI